MMKKLLKLTTALAALMIVSCSSVSMNKPLPNNTTVDQRKELVGEWTTKDGSCKINFDSKGIGQFAYLEWNDESNKFEVSGQSFIYTQAEDDYYLSIQSNDEEGDPTFSLAQCALSEENLILWLPNIEKFEELIKQKKLSGKVTRSKHATSVALSNSPKEIMKILKKERDLFEYREPLVLSKLTN